MKRFDERVWELAGQVPRGRVVTYREIARAMGTKAYRAVGQALRRNSHPVEIPCHRVIRSDGRLGGYAGAMKSRKKVLLLRKEGVTVTKDRVDLVRFGYRLTSA